MASGADKAVSAHVADEAVTEAEAATMMMTAVAMKKTAKTIF